MTRWSPVQNRLARAVPWMHSPCSARRRVGACSGLARTCAQPKGAGKLWLRLASLSRPGPWVPANLMAGSPRLRRCGRVRRERLPCSPVRGACPAAGSVCFCCWVRKRAWARCSHARKRRPALLDRGREGPPTQEDQVPGACSWLNDQIKTLPEPHAAPGYGAAGFARIGSIIPPPRSAGDPGLRFQVLGPCSGAGRRHSADHE